MTKQAVINYFYYLNHSFGRKMQLFITFAQYFIFQPFSLYLMMDSEVEVRTVSETAAYIT